MIEIANSKISFSLNLAEIYRLISQTGWSVKNVKYDKSSDRFTAIGTSPTGREITSVGPSDKWAIANLYSQITRVQSKRTSAAHLSKWKHDFKGQIKEIAEAYVKAPIYDPKAAIAFKALADDSLHRSASIAQRINVQITNNPEPYHTIEKMVNDVRKKQRLWVTSIGADQHPIWSSEQVIAFRTCFDILGYVASDSEWNWEGDCAAFAAYAPLVSATAQQALFSEVLGQSAYITSYRAYSPQKVAIFPKLLKDVQEKEGVHKNFQGLHPSQSILPVELPEYEQEKPEKESSVHTGGADDLDPNHDWFSNFEPKEPNAYLHYGDPLEKQETLNNAKRIDTEWHMFKTIDGGTDFARMRDAVIKALRVAILSVRRDLRGNSIMYQHVEDVPTYVDDPHIYLSKWEKNRERWNQKHDENDPNSLFTLRPQLIAAVSELMPELTEAEAVDRSGRIIENLERTIEAEILAEQEEKGKVGSSFKIQREVEKKVAKIIKAYIKNPKKEMDFVTSDTREEPEHDAGEGGLTEAQILASGRYPAIKYNADSTIANLDQYGDALLESALTDVVEHNGSGHHFRKTAMDLNIPYVGPKVASFAWLLLNPMTSELAVIDTHLRKTLGDPPKGSTVREYYRHERELGAARDASGYEDVPLGAFGWGLWDYMRTGPGNHQDHSALRVSDPTPHHEVEWQSSLNNQEKAGVDASWWDETLPEREQVGKEWEENEGQKYPISQVPYKKTATLKGDFKKQWDKRIPIEMKDIRPIAEYGGASYPSSEEMERFVMNHKRDIQPGWPDTYSDWKTRYMQEYRKWRDTGYPNERGSKVAASLPWYILDGERVEAKTASTIMKHIVESTGMTTPEVWAKIDEAGH